MSSDKDTQPEKLTWLNKHGKTLKQTFIAVALIGIGSLFYNAYKQSSEPNNIQKAYAPKQMVLSEFKTATENGYIDDITIKAPMVSGTYTKFNDTTSGDPDIVNRKVFAQGVAESSAYDLLDDLDDHADKVGIEVSQPSWWSRNGYTVMFGGLIGFFVFAFVMNRRAQKKQTEAMNASMNKTKGSKAVLFKKDGDRVTFDDVAGIDEARGDVEKIVRFLNNAEQYKHIGGEPPKGALLVGPPGTGKTLLARAIAGEADVPFYSVSGSDFVEMFVGVGAARVRQMFEEVQKNAPCVVFIDEIDALAKRRGVGQSNDEREQTLNALLVEMDGFSANQGVVLIGATNQPETIDPAIKRSGRMDMEIEVGLPDVDGREAILRVHTKKKRLSVDVDLREVARATPGFSGADLANLANKAVIDAADRGATEANHLDFLEARDRMMMGAAKRTKLISDIEKKSTAYHEAGHALMMMHEPHSDPLHKVTIMPRGRAAGVAMWLPEEGGLKGTYGQFAAKLRVAAAGRIAEELLFDPEDVTAGAVADIQMMTDYADKMIKEYGMSRDAGMRRYAGNGGSRYLGGGPGGFADVSEKTKEMVDAEVNRLIREACDHTYNVLTDPQNFEQLHKLAAALQEQETLSAKEVKELVDMKPIEDKYKLSRRIPSENAVEQPSIH